MPKFYIDRVIVTDGAASDSISMTPATGDMTPLAMGFIALVVSALGIIAVIVTKKYSFR